MLVLTRNVNESIVIDGNIRVTVISFGKGKVRLGVNAPSTMRVDRDEVHARRAGEEAAARLWGGAAVLAS